MADPFRRVCSCSFISTPWKCEDNMGLGFRGWGLVGVGGLKNTKDDYLTCRPDTGGSRSCQEVSWRHDQEVLWPANVYSRTVHFCFITRHETDLYCIMLCCSTIQNTSIFDTYCTPNWCNVDNFNSCTNLHCSKPHYKRFNYPALHCIAKICNSQHSTALQNSSEQKWTTLQWTTLQWTTL